MELQPSQVDRKLFLGVFSRLAVALREPADETGVTQQVYYDALADLPYRAIEASAATLMRETGRRFFPTTAEWRSTAEAALEQEVRKSYASHRAEPWKLECPDCDDTGWRSRTCDGSRLCGREKTHAPHEFVTICPCRARNRTFQRHHHPGQPA